MAQEGGTSLYDRPLGFSPSTGGIGKQEIDGMLRKLAVAVGALGLVTGAVALGTQAHAQDVKGGA